MVSTSRTPRGGVNYRWMAPHQRARALALWAALALVAGAVLILAGADEPGRLVWRIDIALLSLVLAVDVGRTVVVDRSLGVDSVALVAMLGCLALGEELAGAVVGLMYAGGSALDEWAAGRARRELTRLVERAPRRARLRIGDAVHEVPVDRVVAGDVVLVGTGEVVPVDGTVEGDEAVVDTSALSGEPLPATLARGAAVRSGSANAGAPFAVRADRPAADSSYAALVRLVEQAATGRARFVRMADRYAGVFLPVTLVLAGAAWIAAGDPVRALAVLVVATPCPLILAAPIAFVAGLSRAARAGVIVKGAPAIEALGRARTVLFDKTGTLTAGTPEVREVIALAGLGREEVLRMAASVDRLSAHVLSGALARAAAEAGVVLELPTAVSETPGRGIAGTLGAGRVCVGSRAFLNDHGVPSADIAGAVPAAGRGSGEAHVLVGLDGTLAGVIVMADELRPDAVRIVERLRAEGVRHVAMVSGDRRSVAERAGRELGVDRVFGELTPEGKVDVLRTLRADADLRPVVMVGDGVNDAPALAVADVGVALAAAGATISSETADAVITVDRVDRVADAIAIGRRSLRIARQSVLAGMGLSIAAMVVAAAGYLPPVAGALLQEGIDLAVILNALRALRA